MVQLPHLNHWADLKPNKRSGEVTHQQARGDRNDVGYSVLSTDVLAGFGNVTQDTAMDDGSEDEVDMTNQDENKPLFHQPPRPFVIIWGTETGIGKIF